MGNSFWLIIWQLFSLAIAQTISISSSLISISWSLVSYSKCLRISLPNKVPMTYWSLAIMFLWEFFSITARMIALALFTSAFVRYVGFIILAHWLIMTFWIVTMQTSFCSTKYEELAFNAVLGVIFIFCYFNPVDNATRYRYLSFYIFMFLENTGLMLCWFKQTKYDLWFKETVLCTHYTCFFLGLIFMVGKDKLILNRCLIYKSYTNYEHLSYKKKLVHIL